MTRSPKRASGRACSCWPPSRVASDLFYQRRPWRRVRLPNASSVRPCVRSLDADGGESGGKENTRAASSPRLQSPCVFLSFPHRGTTFSMPRGAQECRSPANLDERSRHDDGLHSAFSSSPVSFAALLRRKRCFVQRNGPADRTSAREVNEPPENRFFFAPPFKSTVHLVVDLARPSGNRPGAVFTAAYAHNGPPLLKAPGPCLGARFWRETVGAQ